MRDSVDFVKLDRNHLGIEAIRIVDHTAPLYDIDCSIGHEPLGGPARVVRVWVVVAVEDADDIGAYIERLQWLADVSESVLPSMYAPVSRVKKWFRLSALDFDPRTFSTLS